MTKASEEWTRAEETMALVLGFKVTRLPGDPKQRQDDAYQLITLDFPKPGEPKIRSVQPTIKATYDAWAEAVRYRIDHDAACKLAWDLYAAATGVTIQSFNGMPAGEPVAHVREERARLLSRGDDYRSQANTQFQLLEKVRTVLFGTDWTGVDATAMRNQLRAIFGEEVEGGARATRAD
jgi:hypothetical protein